MLRGSHDNAPRTTSWEPLVYRGSQTSPDHELSTLITATGHWSRAYCLFIVQEEAAASSIHPLPSNGWHEKQNSVMKDSVKTHNSRNHPRKSRRHRNICSVISTWVWKLSSHVPVLVRYIQSSLESNLDKWLLSPFQLCISKHTKRKRQK